MNRPILKKKHFTLEPRKPKLISSNDPAMEIDSIQYLLRQSEETPRTDLNFPNAYGKSFDNRKIKNHITVLDEMGFGTYLETKANVNSKDSMHLRRRFSIGICEFWTEQDKQKFLRNDGYAEAFKKLKEENVKTKLYHTKSIRKPDLPYIMDNNTLRRTYLINGQITGNATARNHPGNFSIPKTISKKSQNDINKIKLTPIDTVVTSCKNLAIDTKRLKDMSDKLNSLLTKKFGDVIKKNPNKRISKYETSEFK